MEKNERIVMIFVMLIFLLLPVLFRSGEDPTPEVKKGEEVVEVIETERQLTQEEQEFFDEVKKNEIERIKFEEKLEDRPHEVNLLAVFIGNVLSMMFVPILIATLVLKRGGHL